jgi:hypothetical protein
MAQIGTIQVETQNSGTVDVPVFETGDSSSDIYEFVRVETASGTGFIPVTDTSNAAYPYLRVQSQNNGIVAITDTKGSTIIEYFENGDISGYGGDTTGFDAVNESSETVYGDYVLKSNNNINNKHIGDTGVTTQQGETYEWRVKTDDDLNNQYFFIGVQNEKGVSGTSGYGLNLNGDRIRIMRVDSGSFNQLDSTTSVYSSTQTWFRGEVAWGTDDSISFTLKDDANNSLGSASATDANYASGGIGFQDRSDGGVWWDYVEKL